MAVTLKVSFEDAAPQAALARASFGAVDMTELMDIVGTVLVNGAVERISSTNVSPDGVPWPKSLRAMLGGGDDGEPGAGNAGPTLHDTGRLMRSITSEAEPTRVAIGSNLIYAGVHQTGATITPKTKGALFFTLANGEQVIATSVKIPARPYLGISQDERADIEDLSLQYFADLLDQELPR
ncbi:phage virion morphogenesis protein [Salipiger aestuarii]|uniref:phage virion morphogenesis protein n=1 Tax=Salipiger aestuarii TaxID=568098 RepID=UPI00123BE812|nr:phage virion morphogenesis protein [Salipiger aestuarii]